METSDNIYNKNKWKLTLKKSIFNFIVGCFIWYVFIAFFAFALKGNVPGFGNKQWWYETGMVYIVWGILNYLIFYGITQIILPRWITNRNYKKIILYSILLIFIVALLKYYFVTLKRFEYVFVSYYKDANSEIPVFYSFREYIQKAMLTGTLVSIIAFGYGLISYWFKSEKARKNLETKQLIAELAFLRMQINPHFLFNSLNSIYSLSLKQSLDTPKAVLKLSEMMRYMLYELEDENYRVLLDKEIEYLTNFIGLQKIRFSDNVFIDFNIIGETLNKKITPLLLIPFVENAFKHGVYNNKLEPITIKLQVDNNKLIFEVKNKINKDYKDFNGGIGLENTKKRLALLYPDKNVFSIENDLENYKIKLELFL